MSELTDDQLDGLFRKSAEEFDPPYDPAAWQAMKTRLDTHDRPMPGGTPIWKNLLRWGLPVLLLLLTVGGWYAYRQTSLRRDASPATAKNLPPTGAGSPSDQAAIATQRQPSAAPRLAHPNAGRTPSTGVLEHPVDNGNLPAVTDKPIRKPERSQLTNRPDKLITLSDKPITPTIPTTTGATNDKTGPLKPTTETSWPSRSELKPAMPTTTGALVRRPAQRMDTGRAPAQKRSKLSRTGAGNPTAFSSMSDANLSPSSFNKQPLVSKSKSEQVASVNGPDGIIKPESDEPVLVSLPSLTELAIRPAHWSPALTFAGRVVESHPDTIAHRVDPASAATRGLSVRLVVSPDLSSVGLKNFARPGTNIGVLLEYRLAARWSVQAGVIQSTKVYQARMTDYAEPADWAKWLVKPEGVDGRCNMLDIPVNVRYDVALRPRLDGRPASRWFVSGGVTSYVIKQEDYSYTYADPANPHIYPGNWSKNASGGNFGFSQLNLSAGYERAISQRLSWQVEPFLKAPLRGVGYFKINLLSTGAFFSIRYKL